MQSYMEAFSYFLQNNQIFLYVSGLSTIFFLLSLMGLSWLISIIPHNYIDKKKRVSFIKMKNPAKIIQKLKIIPRLICPKTKPICVSGTLNNSENIRKNP